jgi:small-conductance mechanosensitive channel
MLKPPEHGDAPRVERPVGELVHQLVEEAKAYARAELGVAKAMATAKGKALALPAGLLGAALLVGQAAVTVLAVAVFFALSLVMNPILAGLLAFLVFAALAGGLAWYGVQLLRRDL